MLNVGIGNAEFAQLAVSATDDAPAVARSDRISQFIEQKRIAQLHVAVVSCSVASRTLVLSRQSDLEGHVALATHCVASAT